MCDADDYESLPESTPLSVSIVAGATAGVAEHCVMFPVDSVKTRMQSLVCDRQHGTMRQVFSTMVREEGVFRPLKGVSAMAAGAGPAHAMYFTALEKCREGLALNGVPEHLASGAAAVVATMLHDAVMTPADVVKQRMQMCCSPFSTCTEASLGIYRTEGMRAFYRSYATQLAMNLPFQTAMVTSYSVCQSVMNPERQYNPAIHFVAGAAAGGIASLITMPLDVCKTLLNTQEAGALRQLKTREVSGLASAARSVYRLTGVRGFFQGLTPRILYQAPSTAVSWSVYEFFKAYLKDNADKGDERYDTVAELRLPQVRAKEKE